MMIEIKHLIDNIHIRIFPHIFMKNKDNMLSCIYLFVKQQILQCLHGCG